MTIRLYNTLTKSVEDFVPVSGTSLVKIYTCGPTVYNYAHIGNIRSFLFADLLQRVLRNVGKYDVQWVMNITDIDDKTIRDSVFGSTAWKNEMGEQTDNPNENISKFTRFFEKEFINDITNAGIEQSHFYNIPRATEYITEMQDLIRKICENGFGYVSEGSVYFSLSSWLQKSEYGRLFAVDTEHFRAGVRIDADEYDRESVSDFVLWKARKDGEPFWDFEINGENVVGRPGWHIECSAMGHKILGLPFDIHTGGVDLRFPHHEDEIAQSKAGYGLETATFWCHHEFLEVEGKKMSKSLGNFFTLHDLIEKGYDAIDIRFLMLSVHYASVMNFTFSGIESAQKARKRIQDFIHNLFDKTQFGTENASIKHEVFEALADNLHTPKALEHIFSFINRIDTKQLAQESKNSLIEEFTLFNTIFNVWEIAPKAEEIIPQEIIDLAEQRMEAKKNKNFAESDRLRNEIVQKGYLIKDTKDGYTLELSER